MLRLWTNFGSRSSSPLGPWRSLPWLFLMRFGETDGWTLLEVVCLCLSAVHACMQIRGRRRSPFTQGRTKPPGRRFRGSCSDRRRDALLKCSLSHRGLVSQPKLSCSGAKFDIKRPAGPSLLTDLHGLCLQASVADSSFLFCEPRVSQGTSNVYTQHKSLLYSVLENLIKGKLLCDEAASLPRGLFSCTQSPGTALLLQGKHEKPPFLFSSPPRQRLRPRLPERSCRR